MPAGEAGEREHLPAGLRSSHGFCESGSPLTPVAGQEGPRWCQRVRGITNGSKYHHLKGSERSGTNLLTCVYRDTCISNYLPLKTKYYEVVIIQRGQCSSVPYQQFLALVANDAPANYTDFLLLFVHNKSDS